MLLEDLWPMITIPSHPSNPSNIWLWMNSLDWSIVVDDHWSKKIYRPKMIVWFDATFILRWSLFLLWALYPHLVDKSIKHNLGFGGWICERFYHEVLAGAELPHKIMLWPNLKVLRQKLWEVPPGVFCGRLNYLITGSRLTASGFLGNLLGWGM